jgi:hypothetical protein
METIDEEIYDAAENFIEKAVKQNKPVLRLV